MIVAQISEYTKKRHMCTLGKLEYKFYISIRLFKKMHCNFIYKVIFSNGMRP